MSNEEDKTTEMDGTEGFKIEDRRKFTSEGEAIEADPESHEVEGEDPRSSQSEPAEEGPARDKEPEIDFAGFLLSLATSALAHLGEVPDPATGKTTENLGGAKQMIDILEILQKKTKGNLEDDENRLLEHLLYELRMKYLNKTKVITL